MIALKNIVSISILLLSCCFAPALLAQPTLPDEEVDVIKDFEASLEESEKIDLTPELPQLDTNSRQLTYALPTRTIQMQYLPPRIRPLAIKRDAVEPSYDGYIKLGYGTPNRPFGELAYNNTKNEKYDVGGNLKYHAANRKEREHQRFQEIDGELNGSYYFDQGFATSGAIGFRSDAVHFYGYDNDTRTELQETVQQRFNTIAARGKFFNGVRTAGDINYSAGFDLYSLTDSYASNEFGFDLEVGATKWLNELHPITIILDADFTSFKNGERRNLHNFGIRPSFTFHGDVFKAKVGINATSHKDNFRIFPDAEVSANIVGNQLAAYLGAGGGLYKNSFRNLTNYNPYLVSRITPVNTDNLKFYGGVKGNLRIIDYQVQASYKIANNLALFVNDPLDTIRFQAVYDSVNIFNIEGTLEANPREDLRVLLTLSQNFYNTSNQAAAWHLPNLQFNAGVYYTTLKEKLVLSGELFVENGVKYQTLRNTEDRLGGLFDINLGAKYKLNKRIGLFFHLNNVLNNTRERWKGYNIYGFNILGGITAKF